MFFKTIGYFLYILLFVKTCLSDGNYPPESWKSAFFKALPVLHLMFIVMSTAVKTKGHETYKRTIIVAQIFSIAGDVSLIWREKLFMAGLLFFAITQLFYIRAFGFKPRGSPAILTSCLLLAGLTFLYVQPGIHSTMMQGLVLVYTVLIYGMLWRSWIQMQANPSIGAMLAVVGAALFILSDFLIAKDKFIGKIPDGQLYILGTYWIGQLLITASVAYYKPHPYRKADEHVFTYKERLN